MIVIVLCCFFFNSACRFVVKLIGVCTAMPPISLVMEYVDGGNLASLLHSELELPWIIRLAIVEEIAMGIHVLHSHIPEVSILYSTGLLPLLLYRSFIEI